MALRDAIRGADSRQHLAALVAEFLLRREACPAELGRWRYQVIGGGSIPRLAAAAVVAA